VASLGLVQQATVRYVALLALVVLLLARIVARLAVQHLRWLKAYENFLASFFVLQTLVSSLV